MSARKFIAFCFLLLATVAARAQCAPLEPADNGLVPKFPVRKPAPEEPLPPEAGFLSDTHYTSQFFGFSFDLPINVHGHEIMLPVMPEKQHALLALQYEEEKHKGYLMVLASGPVPGFDADIPEEQEQPLRDWSQEGTGGGQLPRYEFPDSMLSKHRFYHRNGRIKGMRATEYWTDVKNYRVKIFAASTDSDFLRRVKDAMGKLEFYCPTDDGTLTDEDGKPVRVSGMQYTGPTVPTDIVDTALRETPAKNIPPGSVADGVYRNPEIGLRYELPKEWQERPPVLKQPPTEAEALREYQFLHACSQTLLQSVPPGKQAGSTILLRALDPNCLGMRTPASLTDKRTLDEVAASLEKLGEFGQVDRDELMSTSGHVFMVFHGTTASGSRADGLAERLSQTIFATRYNKLLLVWTFVAPDNRALGAMPTGAIGFESSPLIHLEMARRKEAPLAPNAAAK